MCLLFPVLVLGIYGRLQAHNGLARKLPCAGTYVDMPESALADYEEARSIAAKSPRGAAAFPRLAI